MENNHIDQQFNEASKLSEEPTVFPGFEKVWEKIEEKLDKKEGKKRIMPLWLPYGIAVSLVIGLGAFYFMNKKEVPEPLKPVIAENTKSKGPVSNADVAKIDSTVKENIRKEELPGSVPLPLAHQSLPVVETDLYKSPPAYNIPPVKAPDRIISSLPEIYNDTLKTQRIEEVVVMGYSKTVKSEITSSSTAMIASADKTFVRPHAAVSSLAGSVAGIEVASGIKRGGEIVIRGTRSVDGRSASPLYIIDGVISGRKSEILDILDPKKIKEVKVLKGLEAAALYGSKANNGVIVITTKGLSATEIESLKKIASDSVKEAEESETALPKAGQQGK
ncbi:TonB-dependent receptor plug domain-containing protein [Chryseobacterium sp. CBSDS_008]|uniref:TonB-dependent receptor plug domain-containing protein n=1 Tax=Chryseobacterium sp. CBSDS_008 TaxID=3415265 RepID=UPI003CF64808